MFTTVLVTIAAIAIIMGGMAIGVIFSGRRLQGSCGGVGSGSCSCEKAGLPSDGSACATKQ